MNLEITTFNEIGAPVETILFFGAGEIRSEIDCMDWVMRSTVTVAPRGEIDIPAGGRLEISCL